MIRVGYLGSVSQRFLNPSLAALRRSRPDVKVKLHDQSPGEQIAALRRGEIDIAVTGQEGALASSEFYTRRLETFPVVAVLPADHRLAGRKVIPLSALKGEPFLSAPEEDMPGRDRWVVQLCRKAGFRPRFMIQGDSIGEMFTLVSSEGMVALAPAYIVDLAVAGVAMVPISDPGASWDFLVMWQRGKTSDAVQALLEALENTVEESCHKERARKQPKTKDSARAPIGSSGRK
jgi:DNA-binding transcriptional LysR family regulator